MGRNRAGRLLAGLACVSMLLTACSTAADAPPAKGASCVDAAAYVTGEVNTVIKARAEASQAQCVDLRVAFRGRDYS